MYNCDLMIIVQGPASEEISSSVANLLDLETVSVDCKTFPDGESRLCLAKKIEKQDTIIIHSTGSPQDKRMNQLSLLVDICKEMDVKSLRVVTPYLAYARQDRRQNVGECISILTIMKILESLGVDELITVNVHNPDVFKDLKIKFKDLSAIPSLAS
jgi:ribose-phosphate pyrophosphokinase